MKSLVFFALVLVGASSALNLDNVPLDGHKKLHAAMRSILSDLHGTQFHSEMKNEFNRTQRILAIRIHPYLTRTGIRIMNPQAYHSLLRHLLYVHSRRFVNTSKALDNMAESAVLKLHNAKMLNSIVRLHTLQRNLGTFFNQLHNHIGEQAAQLLKKHRVNLGRHHVHFLIHISAKAILRGENVRERVTEHLRMVLDKPLAKDQQQRLVEAALELAKNIQQLVRTQFHDQIATYLAKKVHSADTHPYFINSALHHFRPLMHQCPRNIQRLLGHRYNHYEKLSKKAFGPKQNHHLLITHLHNLVGPMTLEHMNRVAAILQKHKEKPQHSVISYLGAYHMRPEDEVDLPWYKCFMRRVHGLVRFVWLIFALVLGGALLGTAIVVIFSNSRRKKVLVKKAPKGEIEDSSKLPYVSLVEEKVPVEA